MKTLLLMRHAKSSWSNESLSDFDRPLNKRGRKSAPIMAARLAELGMVPNEIWTSTSCRTTETLKLMTEEWGEQPTTHALDELYLASASTLVEVAVQADDAAQVVMLLAHNPGMETLASHLYGDAEAFPTAAIGRFDLDIEHWSELADVVETPGAKIPNREIWRPRELDDE